MADTDKSTPRRKVTLAEAREWVAEENTRLHGVNLDAANDMSRCGCGHIAAYHYPFGQHWCYVDGCPCEGYVGIGPNWPEVAREMQKWDTDATGRADGDDQGQGAMSASGAAASSAPGDQWPPDELVEAAARDMSATAGCSPWAEMSKRSRESWLRYARAALAVCAPEIARRDKEIRILDARDDILTERAKDQDEEIERLRNDLGLAQKDLRMVCDTAGLDPGVNGPDAADEIGEMLDEREQRAAEISRLAAALDEQAQDTARRIDALTAERDEAVALNRRNCVEMREALEIPSDATTGEMQAAARRLCDEVRKQKRLANDYAKTIISYREDGAQHAIRKELAAAIARADVLYSFLVQYHDALMHAAMMWEDWERHWNEDDRAHARSTDKAWRVVDRWRARAEESERIIRMMALEIERAHNAGSQLVIPDDARDQLSRVLYGGFGTEGVTEREWKLDHLERLVRSWQVPATDSAGDAPELRERITFLENRLKAIEANARIAVEAGSCEKTGTRQGGDLR